MSYQNYQTIYGVGLLDDLHNYFPALLYDSSSFSSVADVLRYVQQQTRSRFDLYSYGQREYNVNRPGHQQNSFPDSRQQRMWPSVANATGNNNRNRASNFTNVPVPVSIEQNTVSYSVDIEEEGGDDENNIVNTTRLLMSLLNVPRGPIVRSYTTNNPGFDAFLQPVLVRPTAEQITANTTVGHFISDTEHSCAICQDILQGEQESRKLNVCGHWFHKNCIDTWFLRNVHCPVCRHDVRVSGTQ